MVTRLSSVSAAGSLIHNPALARICETGLILAGMPSLILIGRITIPLPFTPVPITMDTFTALGVGAVFGSCRDVLSVLLLGVPAVVRVPVLASWSGGAIVTFGYVIGYILIVTIAGRAATVWSRHSGSTAARVTTGVTFMSLALTSVYIPGLIWLKVAIGAGWGTALCLGLVPFIMGDIFKSVVATGLLPVHDRPC